jgi:hypothetical protein
MRKFILSKRRIHSEETSRSSLNGWYYDTTTTTQQLFLFGGSWPYFLCCTVAGNINSPTQYQQ